MAAPFPTGAGRATVQYSNMIRGGGPGEAWGATRDPNWELNVASEDQTSVFVEPVSSRVLTAVGFVRPTALQGQDGPNRIADKEYWGELSEDKTQFSLQFFFEDVDLQDCYSLQVESVMLQGFPAIYAYRARNAELELCGGGVDDQLTGQMSYYSFKASKASGEIRIRELRRVFNAATREYEHVKHNVRVFSQSGEDDGWYTPQEILEHIRDKLAAHFSALFAPANLHVELYVNPSGRIVLAWSADPAIVAATGGGIQMDISADSSRLWQSLSRYVMLDKYRRGTLTYGTVVNGDGFEFVRRQIVGGLYANVARGAASDTMDLCAVVSPELSEFQRKDSITPFAVTGEIASGQLNWDEDSHQLCMSAATGNMIAPKIDFDPAHQLTRFTATIVMAANMPFLDAFFTTLEVNRVPQDDDGPPLINADDIVNIAKRLVLQLLIRIY